MSQKFNILMMMWSKSYGHVPALCSLSDPRFAAQLPVTAACSRPTPALSPHPQFPEEALTFLLPFPFTSWLRTQAVLVMSHWPPTCRLLFSLAQCLAESRRELWSHFILCEQLSLRQTF